MPLSKLIVNAYETLIEIALWGTLLLAIIGGASVGSEIGGGWIIFGMLVGIGLWLIFAVLVFGAFLVMLDIRNRLKSLQLMKSQPPGRENKISSSEASSVQISS